MDAEITKIKNLLLVKSSTKQLVFRNTKTAFDIFRSEAQFIINQLIPELKEFDKHVEVFVSDKTPFEFHVKFSGDTLVFMMHTNVFDFDENHLITKSKYTKKNKLLTYCGLIQVYNFLSDTIKYNREADAGFLVARFFINSENHFLLEGKKSLSYLLNDFENQIFDQASARKIILEAIAFAINFDLTIVEFDEMQFITLEQKNMMSHSSGMPTNKTLGFSPDNDININY
jgi:hypothetical protein